MGGGRSPSGKKASKEEEEEPQSHHGVEMGTTTAAPSAPSHRKASASQEALLFRHRPPSDLHLWVEPGLADTGLQRQRRQAKRREVFSELLHRPTLPCLQWLKTYRPKQDLMWDVQAAVVVTIIVIPQGMAYAGLANLSPVYGLYCAIFPAFVYAVLGPSRDSAIGAMALVSIMVGDAVLSATPAGAPLAERVAVAVKLAFLTGIMQIVMGLLRLGEVASYVSHPVMQGFSSGGEILIAVSQLKMLFGIKIPQKEYAWQTVYHLLTHIRETKPWTLALGVVTCAILFAVSKWRRVNKARMETEGAGSVRRTKRTFLLLANFMPFVLVICAALIAYAMQLNGVAIDVVGKVPQGLRMFPSYAVSGNDLQRLAQPAVLLALISFMLSFAVSKKYSEKGRNPYEVDANQELFAIGVAHAVGSLFGAFPVAGSFSRTAVAVEASQRSQISGILMAFMVLLAVNFLTSTFYWIPQCALAALVQAAIFSVMDFSPFAYAYRASKSEFFVMVCTFLVTLGLGIDKGILAGVALSIVALIRRASHPRLKVLGIVRGPRHVTFRDVTRYPAALMPAPGVCIIRIDESVNFASCASVKDQLLHIAHDPAYVRRHHVVGDRDHNGGGNGNDNGAGGGAHGSSSNGNGGGAPPPPPAATNCLASAGSPIATLMRGVRLPGGGARSQSEEPHHHPRPEKVVVDFSSVNNVDLSGIKALDEVQATLAREKQAMYVCNVKSNVRDKLRDSPIWERLGGDLLFLSLPALLDHLCGRGKWCGADNATTGGGNGGRQEQSQKTEGGEGQQVSVDDQQQFEAGEQEQGEQGFDGYADWDT